jgi:hypothetical protein
MDHIQDRSREFWYYDLVIKGAEEEEKIRKGIEKALEYVDVGIHLQESSNGWYPTISPREEDLLRRCILSEKALGIDLRWWTAEIGQSIGMPTQSRGPTKVLMGRFILDDGMGPSLPVFCKFEPSSNANFVRRDIKILSHKLEHIKEVCFGTSSTRSLIVTQSVTNGVPESLSDYLHRSPTEVGPRILEIVDQIGRQLAKLGDDTPDQVLPREMLWKSLDKSSIEKAWGECQHEGLESPLNVLSELEQSEKKVWAMRRSCIHWDLNATNIAIDVEDAGYPKAFIFDAGGMAGDFGLRDLAYLEVTTILFNSFGRDAEVVETCKVLYEAGIRPPRVVSPERMSSFGQNVLSTVLAIRERITSPEDCEAYAILVFDAVLRQLQGLNIQPSRNKVKDMGAACKLASWASVWVKRNVLGVPQDRGT